MGVILDTAKLPPLNKIPWPERLEEMNKRFTALYQERADAKIPATLTHMAAALGVDLSVLNAWRAGKNGCTAEEECFREFREAIDVWFNRFDSLCQDIMNTKELYQPAMYQQKAHFGHLDTTNASKETVTVSFELIRGELEKVKAELPVGSFPSFVSVMRGEQPAETIDVETAKE